MKQFVLISCALLLAAIFVETVRSANAPTNAPAKGANSESKGRGLPFHGNIEAVDKTAKTITMRGEKHRVFHVTAQTKINKDKVRATLNSVMVGDSVGGYARETADGKFELVTLNIGSGTGKSKAPAEKTGK